MKIPVAIVDDKSQNRLLFKERLNASEDISIVLTATDFYGIKKYILSLLSGINTLVFHKWCIIFYHSEYS